MSTNRHFLDFAIAGLTYYDLPMVYEQLHVGTKLRLVREADNPFDPYAVALYYEDAKLGFVPRSENHELSKFCEQGYTDIFEVRINRISSQSDVEGQIGVVIYIKAAQKSAI